MFLQKTKPSLLKSVAGTGFVVELFSDGFIYTLNVLIEDFSAKPGTTFFTDYREADMAFQDAVLATEEKGTLH